MTGSYILFVLYTLLVVMNIGAEIHEDNHADLLVVTVASNETDGYKRLMDSAKHYDLKVEVLGMNKEWLGGNMDRPGGGYKINLLKDFLATMLQNLDESDQKSSVIMFIDAYDTILLGDKQEILDKFDAMDASIVFSAEIFCWPDKELHDKYPVTESPYKYLNSGGFIGYARDVYNLIKDHPIDNKGDDQLYLTKLFLDQGDREKYRMRLDTKASIFQNLHGSSDDVTLRQDEASPNNGVVLVNTRFDTTPLVVHGNGLSKLHLNSLANYLAGAWHPLSGCRDCRSIPGDNSAELPLPQNVRDDSFVLLAIFITAKTPFLQEFFGKIRSIDYPKNRVHLFVYNMVDYHEGLVDEFIKNYGRDYVSVKRIKPKDSIDERTARTFTIERCLWKKCNYLFVVDSVAHMDSPNVLKALISSNKSFVGPMLVRPFKAWSNFWGAINTDGFYARSFDYMDIVTNARKGLWNVPYVTHCYLVNATVLPHLIRSFADTDLDPEMSFCSSLRKQGIFMYVDNLEELGHLIDNEEFSESTRTNPEFYELFSNQVDWEKRYIHPDFSKNLEPGANHQQPCPDVYWFPIVTPKFCSDLIEIMEAFGQWSSGNNYDERLTGGYENVPTRDIHMNQIGFERHWLHFLKQYVRPLQEAVFIGYYHDPPESIMNFVVRYRPDEQPSLRPHHDSSTYTINIALNKPHVDYEGGGCRFLRYNCSVTDSRLGWVLMHPGRLTHYHEGLPVTKGTRYIMISFVNP